MIDALRSVQNYLMGILVVLVLMLSAARIFLGDSAPRVLLVALTLALIGLSIRWPLVAGFGYCILFLDIAYNEHLRNVFSVFGASLVTGALAYKKRYLIGGIISLVLWYIGSTELFDQVFIPGDVDGALILASILIAGFLVGTVIGRIHDHYDSEKQFSAFLREAHRESTVRMLHDSVAHKLTSVVMRAESLLLNANLNRQNESSLKLIANDTREAMEGVRTLIRLINSDGWNEYSRAHRPEIADLNEMATFMMSHGFPSLIRNNDSLRKVSRKKRRIVSLALSELATNIIKYAKFQSQVTLDLSISNDGLYLQIESESAETQSHKYLSTGLGLNDIENNIENLGGTFSYGPREGIWRTFLYLPL